MAKVAVVLAGCGVYDGAEINEAKKILANEATALCRGADLATDCCAIWARRRPKRASPRKPLERTTFDRSSSRYARTLRPER